MIERSQQQVPIYRFVVQILLHENFMKHYCSKNFKCTLRIFREKKSSLKVNNRKMQLIQSELNANQLEMPLDLTFK